MLYNIQENVKIVISLLKAYNIRHIVVSPGGTNIPISIAVQNDDFFKCYSVPDERSAMYFAIGLYLQTGEIVATSCTSAQATRNYIPGLTEAYYKHAPILAITTAKLERFQYQDYMQAPDQCSLPKDSVKKSFDLPPVTDVNTRKQCILHAKEAILELTHHNKGPVQLNLRIVDSLQSSFEESKLPNIPVIRRYKAWDDWEDTGLDGRKILIVIGEHRPFTERQRNAIESFCECYNVVVYANHLSNFSGKYTIKGNLLVSCGGLKQLKPDILITIGGQTGDYPLYGNLQGLCETEHWRVSEDGDVVDTYGYLRKIFECPDYFFFEKLKRSVIAASHDYFDAWSNMNAKMKYDVELPFSNLYIAQQLYRHIPKNSIMNFAILNSLRSWSYFPLDSTIHGYSNVSAFGIDGCNSMLIGESMNASGKCFIVTGDLAFFYDMNSLGIRHIRNNLRIILINNGGGAEFKIMTHSWKKDINVDDYISANNHNGSAKGWAEDCGFYYLSAKDKEEFDSVKIKIVEECEKPILLEVFTKEEDECVAMNSLVQTNALKSETESLKSEIKRILGDKCIDFVKHTIRKK